MSSNSVSTMPSSNNPKFEKERIFDGDDKEGIYNQINSLKKILKETFKSYFLMLLKEIIHYCQILDIVNN